MLETLAGPGDRIWTTRLLAPIWLDDGLNVGSSGGHGPVRYRVTGHEPGRRVRFGFDPDCGITGWHEITVTGDSDGAVIRHVLSASPHGVARALWPMVIKSHDAGIEDIFDNLERSLGGIAHPQQHTSRLARTAGPLVHRRRVTQAAASADSLIDASLTRVDFVDAWRTPLMPDDTDDPAWWAERAFAAGVWVQAAMKIRDAVVRPFGIRTSDDAFGTFPLLRSTPRAVVLGVDDKHLRFRVEVACEDKAVTATTAVMLLNGFGRVYWLPVRIAHPLVVRNCLARVLLPHAPGTLGDRMR